LKVTAVIASANRPSCLHKTVVSLLEQRRPADEILISVASTEDCSSETRVFPGVRLIEGPKGSACQRNTALKNLQPDTGLVLFLDDDIELRSDYIQNCIAFMEANPDVAAMSGKVIADGSHINAVISREEARNLIRTHETHDHSVHERLGLYGCNMVVLASVAKEILFDDRMKLYALFEDTDFGIRCRTKGRVVSYHGCIAVHLAEKSGRVSHRRFGFAQVMNVYYLWKKGTLSHKEAAVFFRNVLLGNVKGLLVPYKGRSRAERLTQMSGNVAAFATIFRSGAAPEKIENIR
jgi:GT2 family glycosyltransferase